MTTKHYARLLIASVVSASIAAGPVLAQEAAPAAATPPAAAPAAPAASAPVAAAPAAQVAPAAPVAVAPVAVAPVVVAPAAVAPVAPQAGAQDPWQQEFAVWQAAAAGNTVEEYQGYLTAYPTGKFASIAQARIVKLSTADDKMDTQQAGQAPQQESAPPAPEEPEFTVGTPAEEAVMLSDVTTRREVQGRLTSLGFNTGGTDGVMGPRSRTAISQWQTVISAPVSGYLSYDQLARLRNDSATVYPSWLASRPKPLPPIRRRSDDQLVGRVDDDNSAADAAIALGVLGLAAGVIGGAAMSGGHHHHGGPRFAPHRGGFGHGPRRH
ncbi:peptidoglycan-binding domain-containing protein [Neorhizobium sp. NCHU2750]|uniref:peptidoglycan-binding domain-containing protein n=1 Tax=Neorhizobium sp. NCHU2750 TaxID=1825976 RepID=UPI000EB666F9|nr:hypothetical protein NCHU2750_05200 [Neorhizobium sp. NCHU2750]